MAFFTVTHAYNPKLNGLADEIHPTYRAFFSDLRSKGLNVASGLLGGDTPGVLLIIEAKTLDEIEALLDEDSFKKEKVVSERVVQPWDPVISRF